MKRQVRVPFEVPFFDVDAMDVVWHGHYVKYLELARCALLRTFDYDYPQMKASGYLWPVVELQIKYVASLRFAQHIEIEAQLTEWEHRLKIEYRLYDATSGKRLTKASTTQVAVDMQTREMCFQSPQILLDKLGESAC
jgi:acyl-CoA thioester hydrolase